MRDPLKTRIMLADDHAVLRSGLRLILDAEPDLEVVAEAEDGIEALSRGLSEDTDLAIMDVSMPRMTGLQATRQLMHQRPQMRVLILSMHEDERYLFEALEAGACGFVRKAVADRVLVEACRAAVRGEPFLCPGALTALASDFLERVHRGENGPRDPLTPRELEVLKLIAESYSTREIAETLLISEKTVERHRADILERLGMHDRVQLARYAIRRGLIEA